MNRHQISDGTSVVHRWMADNYADSMLMGLRRIVDRNRRSFSLIRLLKDIEKNSSLLNVDRYVELWRRATASDDDVFPRMLFAKFSSDGRTLNGGKIRADVKRLQDDHEDILKLINTAIAHREDPQTSDPRSGSSSDATWADLDRLFDDVASLFNKYFDLVSPGTHVDFAPVLPAGFERAFVRMVIDDDG
ncbi:MAG: hypothetical protein IH936_08995 [Acidobacteria bacterium]|nr:hypothetical protein [Acidobacteriota bacterium]